MNLLTTFIKKFSSLKVSRTKAYGKAPHKPILLLSIIQSIEYGEITENKVYITPELVARFKDSWQALVKNDHFTSNFGMPFYHLKSDGFWLLQPLSGREIILTTSYSIKSFSALKSTINFAYFNQDLNQLLTDKETRDILKQTLLQTYFNVENLPAHYSILQEAEQQILHESAVVYRKDIEQMDEEDIFIRSGLFKKVIPKAYNYTCCISGMRIIASRDIQMIDACHIVPFSESHDDTIGNGISLSPNFHRAFDRHLITIDENYRVIISPHFTESGSHLIKQFKNKEIHLPLDKQFYPSVDNLKRHKEKFSIVNVFR